MGTLGHLEIKTTNDRMAFFKQRQNIGLFGVFHYVRQNTLWIFFSRMELDSNILRLRLKTLTTNFPQIVNSNDFL
jgi:hypothetical protein